MRVAEIPIFLGNTKGMAYAINFALGLANGIPLSSYPGWLGTANWALDDNGGTFTRGMHFGATASSVAYRQSRLFNGTFTGRWHNTGTLSFDQVICRMNSAGKGGVTLSSDNTSGHWKINFLDAATNTLQLSYDTGVAFSIGTTHNYQLVTNGPLVTALVDGGQVGVTQTDLWSLPSQTYAGFFTNNTGTDLDLCENFSWVP